jgi:hypothetical protein
VSHRFLLWVATAVNVVVAGMTYATLGLNRASAHAAARNTARFAGVCFLVAFAAPVMVRFVRRLPSQATLILAFVAAQGVHFATVLFVLFVFDREQLAQNPLRAALVLTGGFGLVLAAALTAEPRTKRWYTALRALALSVIFVIFTGAFAFNRPKPLIALAVLFLAVLIARIAIWVKRPTRVATGEAGLSSR